MSFLDFVRSHRDSISSAVLAESDGADTARDQVAAAFDFLVGAGESALLGSVLGTERQDTATSPHPRIGDDVDVDALDLVAAAALRAYASSNESLASGSAREHVSVEALDLPSIGFELLCQLQLPLTSRTAEVTRASITKVRRFTSSRPPPPNPVVEPGSSSGDVVLAGSGVAMRRVRATIAQLANRSRAPVLLIGEPGTGKRTFANELHSLTYADGELFELAGDDQLPELDRRIGTSLVRNARINGSGITLYAPSMTHLSAATQARLLRWLEHGDLQMRLIASLTQPLAAAVRSGSVGSQLASRFNVQVELPSLRERAEDLKQLFERCAESVARERAEAPISLSEPALRILERYNWPGNFTELYALVTRLAERAPGGLVAAEHVQTLSLTEPDFRLPRGGINLSELEKNLLQQAMTITSNNQTRAADLLGLTRDQLRYRLAKFELSMSPARTG